MKDAEDEAFDNIARRQGAWGGGYQAKRAAAADKLWDKPSVAFDEWWYGDNDESTNPFWIESGAYWAWAGWKAALAQPAQEPRNVRERWNVELDGNDLLVCFNDHEKGDACQYERYSPQRPWVGLTDDEHETLWVAIRATGYLTKGQVDEVMEVVEAKLKERNS